MSELCLCLQPEILVESTSDLRVRSRAEVQVSTLRVSVQEVGQRLRAREKKAQELSGVRDRCSQGHGASHLNDFIFARTKQLRIAAYHYEIRVRSTRFLPLPFFCKFICDILIDIRRII